MHAVLGKPDGTAIGGHVLELNVNPALEVFMTINTTPLTKKPDQASGMKVIDPNDLAETPCRPRFITWGQIRTPEHQDRNKHRK
jgi:hypothetical protein